MKIFSVAYTSRNFSTCAAHSVNPAAARTIGQRRVRIDFQLLCAQKVLGHPVVPPLIGVHMVVTVQRLVQVQLRHPCVKIYQRTVERACQCPDALGIPEYERIPAGERCLCGMLKLRIRNRRAKNDRAADVFQPFAQADHFGTVPGQCHVQLCVPRRVVGCQQTALGIVDAQQDDDTRRRNETYVRRQNQVGKPCRPAGYAIVPNAYFCFGQMGFVICGDSGHVPVVVRNTVADKAYAHVSVKWFHRVPLLLADFSCCIL